MNNMDNQNSTTVLSKEPETKTLLNQDDDKEITIKNEVDIVERETRQEFNAFMRTILTELETVYPHRRDDKSQNETKFKHLRSKILRHGNDRMNSLIGFMRDFFMYRRYESKRVEIKFDQEKKGNE